MMDSATVLCNFEVNCKIRPNHAGLNVAFSFLFFLCSQRCGCMHTMHTKLRCGHARRYITTPRMNVEVDSDAEIHNAACEVA